MFEAEDNLSNFRDSSPDGPTKFSKKKVRI